MCKIILSKVFYGRMFLVIKFMEILIMENENEIQDEIHEEKGTFGYTASVVFLVFIVFIVYISWSR